MHTVHILYIAIRVTNHLPSVYLVGVNHHEYFILGHTSLSVSCTRKDSKVACVDSTISSCVLGLLGLASEN